MAMGFNPPVSAPRRRDRTGLCDAWPPAPPTGEAADGIAGRDMFGLARPLVAPV
jgi:hypothetical protein